MARLAEWRKQFVGRERLTGQLREAYRLSAAGLPQFRILLGPTGIGKTRLAQEVFRWLSQEHDPPTDASPEGYWPDAFATEASKDDVNPRPDGRHLPSIPWLWWGLKFEESQQPGDALYRGLKDLTPHTVQMLAHREIEAVHGDWLWKLFSLGFGFVPGIGSVPGWIRDGYSAWQGTQRRAEAEERLRERDDQREQRQQNEHVETALEALRSFLDPQWADDPRVPVVLFLDDAHWADPVALQLLHRLWSQARSRRWPLLVIATHWDDEWQRHLADAPSNDETAHRLADFLRILDPHEEAGITSLQVDGIPGGNLQEWLRAALPGITAEQQQLILEKAAALASDAEGRPVPGGSPRIIEQIVLAVHEDPEEFFIDGNPEAALNPDAESWIRHEILDLNSIVRRRFKKLSREVRKALGWSSLQGRRFLAEITTEIAGKIAAGGIPADTARSALETSETAYGWIQRNAEPEQNPGRFNLCDFRQAVFHEVARRHFTISAEERAAADLAINDVLQEWLRAGRLSFTDSPESDTLTREERRDALRMIRHRFDPRDCPDATPVQWSTWGRALATLVILNQQDFLWEQAEAIACEFADARPEGWPTDLVPTDLQCKVADLLDTMDEHEVALQILDPLAADAIRLDDSQASPETLSAAARSLDQHANVCRHAGRLDSYFDSTRHVLRLAKDMLTRFGERTETLINIGVALYRLGTAAHARDGATIEIDGVRRTPLELLMESLAIRRRLIESHGETRRTLQDVSAALNKVANVARSAGMSSVEIEGESRTPLELYLESLMLSRRVVDQHGETTEAFRDISLTLSNVSDAVRDSGESAIEIDGRQRTPLDLYIESLTIMRGIADRYGETPIVLRDISMLLASVGGTAFAEGKPAIEIDGVQRTPLDLQIENLALSREIVSRYGESMSSLRGVCLALDDVGDMATGAGESGVTIDGVQRTSLDLYAESLTLCGRILDRFGESRQLLRDLSVSLDKVSRAARLLGRPSIILNGTECTPLDLELESLTISQQILRRYGETPQLLRDVSVSLDKVGDAVRKAGGESIIVAGVERSFMDLYLESLTICQQLLDRYGATPQSLRDAALTLSRVGSAAWAAGLATVEVGGIPRTRLSLYKESLELRRRIVEQFGESPQRLRNLADGELRVAAAHPTDADTHLRNARDILHSLFDRGWNEARDEEWLEMVDDFLANLSDSSGEATGEAPS